MEPPSDAQLRLLAEIRDAQREHLAAYREAAQRSLQMQEAAVAQQSRAVALYRRVVLVGGVLVAALIALLVYLLRLL